MAKSFLKYWLPLYVYAGIIFYFSGKPSTLPEIAIPFFDKIVHVFEFTVFGLLAARAFKNSSKSTMFENFKILAVIVSVAYGVLDEFHQGFIPERQFSVFDMIADGIGGILGAFVYGSRNPV